MEPKQDVFLPYLQPLLEAPGSRYLLRDWKDKDQWDVQRYIDEGLIPERSELGEQKSPVLIIANLAHQLSKPRDQKTRGRSSHFKALDLAQNVKLRSGFQALGPTRMLLWMTDTSKVSLLPRTVADRSKPAVYLESHVHVEEIAGSAPSFAGRQREDFLTLESSKLVAKRMEEDHIQIPPERQNQATARGYDSPNIRRIWHTELEKLEEDFKALRLSQFVGKAPAPLVDALPGRKTTPDRQLTEEYQRLRTLRVALTSENKRADGLAHILQKQEEIDRLDLEAHREGIDAQQQASELKALDAKIKDYKDELSQFRLYDQRHILFLSDDRRAFALNPPLLNWDRRRAEPLIVQADEFYQPGELALLDLQPKPQLDFSMSTERSIYFDMITTSLFAPGGATTSKNLNTIAPGAFEALVPKLSAIRDPTKGGRRDVDSVRVRTMTPEMFWQLVVAWDEWLFKPALSDSLTQFGISNFIHNLEQRRGITASL